MTLMKFKQSVYRSSERFTLFLHFLSDAVPYLTGRGSNSSPGYALYSRPGLFSDTIVYGDMSGYRLFVSPADQGEALCRKRLPWSWLTHGIIC